jgi:hypothetical protein
VLHAPSGTIGLLAIAGGGGGTGYAATAGVAGGTNLTSNAGSAATAGDAAGTGGNGGVSAIDYGGGGAGWLSIGTVNLGDNDEANHFTIAAGFDASDGGGYGGGGGGLFLAGGPANLMGSITATHTGNGSVTISCSGSAPGGTPPYTYSWSNGQTNSNATSLSAGTYTVTVIDSCGSSSTASVIITQPTALTMIADSIDTTTGNCNGSAWAIVNGGTAPYTYSWTGGLTTDTITNQSIGNYCCTVTDSNGCMDSVCVNIDMFSGINKLTNATGQLTIYPNPNDGNFILTYQSGIDEGTTPILEIYNMLGEKILNEALSLVNSGNLIDLSSQHDGVYLYRVYKY